MIYNYNGDYNMKAVTVNCPNCKAPFDFKDNLKQTKCEHCGSLVFPTKELKEEALNNNSLEAVKVLMENNNFKEAYLRCVRILKNDPTNCEALRYKIVTRLKKMVSTYDLKEDGKSYKINDLMNYDFIDPLKLDLYNLKCDLEELEKIVTSKTKLLCLNNPNNPTGSVIPNWMLEKIVEIAKKNNVWILSDSCMFKSILKKGFEFIWKSLFNFNCRYL